MHEITDQQKCTWYKNKTRLIGQNAIKNDIGYSQDHIISFQFYVYIMNLVDKESFRKQALGAAEETELPGWKTSIL